MAIIRVHQVLATDITYVPMAQGYMYLMAIIDSYSRYVLDCQAAGVVPPDDAFLGSSTVFTGLD